MTTADQWESALAQLGANMGRTRYSVSTRERVVKQCRRFGRDMLPLGPWDVTADHVADWLDRVPSSIQSEYAYRASLRTFYRWARRAGRMASDPTEEIVRRCQPKTLPAGWGPAIDAYLQHLSAAGKPDTTRKLRRAQLRRLAFESAMASPWDATTDDLADWLARHRWSLETRRSHRSSVRGFYAWAYDTGRIERDPALRLPVVKAAYPAPRPASEAAYTEALAKADDRERLMLRLAAELGLRRAEIAQVHRQDLDQRADGWWLFVHGKGGKGRWLPAPDALALLIVERGDGYAFPGSANGHLSPVTVGKLLGPLLPPGVTLHALRHRFATEAYTKSRNILATQQLLGHSSPTTTQRYVAIAPSELRALIGA